MTWLSGAFEAEALKRARKVLIPVRSLKKSRRWEPIDFTGLKLTTSFQKLPNAFQYSLQESKPAFLSLQFTNSKLLYYMHLEDNSKPFFGIRKGCAKIFCRNIDKIVKISHNLTIPHEVGKIIIFAEFLHSL